MPRTKKTKSASNFFDDVYEVVRLIPKGRVSSYGAIGHYLGAKSSARMVGWAMHGCPKDVPAHRVVNSSGLLTGKHHFKTPTTMAHRLKQEGVRVINDKIDKFSDVFWDPAKELI
jgi:methylated-DNA-protein-cysteine methyltransferase related protein